MHWQRNEHPPHRDEPVPEMTEIVNRPPSYLSQDGVDQAVLGALRRPLSPGPSRIEVV